MSILSVHNKCLAFNEKLSKLKIALFVADTQLMLLDNCVLIKICIVISCSQRYLPRCKTCLVAWIWYSPSLLNILAVLYVFNLMFENSVASITRAGYSYFFASHCASGILLWFPFLLTPNIRTKLGRGCWLLPGIKNLHKSKGLGCSYQKWSVPDLLKIYPESLWIRQFDTYSHILRGKLRNSRVGCLLEFQSALQYY